MTLISGYAICRGMARVIMAISLLAGIVMLNWRWKLLKPVEDCLTMSLVWLVATALVAF